MQRTFLHQVGKASVTLLSMLMIWGIAACDTEEPGYDIDALYGELQGMTTVYELTGKQGDVITVSLTLEPHQHQEISSTEAFMGHMMAYLPIKNALAVQPGSSISIRGSFTVTQLNAQMEETVLFDDQAFEGNFSVTGWQQAEGMRLFTNTETFTLDLYWGGDSFDQVEDQSFEDKTKELTWTSIEG